MCFKLTNQVWGLDYLSFGEKILLLALADHANDNAQCWPSVAGLAKKCSYSLNTLNKNKHILEGANLITITPRASRLEGRKTDLYEINHSSFHTPEMLVQIKLSRAKVKAKYAKNSRVWNDARAKALSPLRMHTGRNKSSLPCRVKKSAAEINIETEGLEIANELEHPDYAGPKASNGRYY
jgi:hypothetical protein